MFIRLTIIVLFISSVVIIKFSEAKTKIDKYHCKEFHQQKANFNYVAQPGFRKIASNPKPTIDVPLVGVSLGVEQSKLAKNKKYYTMTCTYGFEGNALYQIEKTFTYKKCKQYNHKIKCKN